MIDFNQMIDNHLLRENRPRKAGKYYPSEIGSCMRKTWFTYKFPQETKPELIRIFELGNILHDFVVDVLRSEKNQHIKLIKTEMPCRMQIEDFTVNGRVDDVILLKANEKYLLVEAKSTKDVKYITEPQTQHITQLQFYMHTTGIHDGVVLYLGKSDLQSKVFTVEYSKEKAEEIISRFKELNSCVTKNSMPQAEAKDKKEMRWMCDYCEYKNKCE